MAVSVEMQNISKKFGDTVANSKVDLSIFQGEIHTLLGENGAGKTTLMKMLYGHFKPDTGTIRVLEEDRDFESPRDAINAGVGMVHQHFMLVDNMTIAENIVLGNEPTDFTHMRIHDADQRTRVDSISEQYGFSINPNDQIKDVSVGVQQRVEILKTVSRGAEIIILDEPTAVLTPQEVEELFSVLRNLKERGKSIILITHKLNEALDLSDRITVLRNGRSIGTVLPRKVNKSQLAEMMVGESVDLGVSKPDRVAGEPILSVSAVDIDDADNVESIRDITFEVRSGEIFGIVGVDGNGQTELADAIAGLRKIDAGDIEFQGEQISGLPRRERIEAGIGYIPENRETQGLVMDLDLNHNGLLGNQHSREFSGRFKIFWSEVRSYVRDLIKRYDVKADGPRSRADSLSGGNKQKFIVARELGRDPPLLIAAQPTRGVDVSAIKFIQNQLLDFRQRGRAVLLITSELEAAMQLSDRLAVMYEGSIVDIFDPSHRRPEEVGLLMAGGNSDKGKRKSNQFPE
jgi:simple sugar transport system ATP-binding protein